MESRIINNDKSIKTIVNIIKTLAIIAIMSVGFILCLSDDWRLCICGVVLMTTGFYGYADIIDIIKKDR